MTSSRLACVLISVLTTACTGQGKPAVETGVGPGPGPDSDEALVELPPVVPIADQVVLGGWEWGAPCRVPVREFVGGAGPQISRTFTIEVADDPAHDGFLMTFVDVVEQLRGMTEQAVAAELNRYLAVLPAIRLDADGGFVEFVDLESSLAVLAERAGRALSPDEPASLAARPEVAEAILDRTMLGWYGFWLHHDQVAANPNRVEGERTRHGDGFEYRTTTETFAATEVGDGVWGPQSDDKVWLTYIERLAGEPSAVDLVPDRLDVSAIMDPAKLRPSYVSITVGGSSSFEGSGVYAFRDRRIVTFDWENAEGCV